MPKSDTLIAALLALLLAALLVPFACIGVDVHHDGIMLKPALDVLSGQVLFRDTFMQYGALTCYLQVLALWIYPALLSLKLLMVATYGVTLFFLYSAWRLLLPRSLTLAACGLFIVFIPYFEPDWIMIPWSSDFAMMFQAITLYALLQIIRGERTVAWGAVLGLACAASFWCRQPVGGLLAASLVVIGLALRWTGWTPPAGRGRATLVAAGLGFGAVFALFFAGIVLSGALPAWWYQNFVWPAKWATQVGEDNLAYWTTVYVHPGRGAALLAVGLAVLAPRLLNRRWPVFSPRRAAVYYAGLVLLLALNHAWLGGLLALPDGGWSFALPVVVLLQAALAVGQAAPARARARPAGYHLAATLAGLSLASLTQYYPLPCSRHILWSLAPAFGLVVWSLWRWSSARALFVAGGLAAAFGPAAYDKYRWARYTLAQPLVTVTQPAMVAGMRVPAAQAEDFARIGAALEAIARRAPGTPAALLGNDALYLCFSPVLDNPGPYFVAWTDLLPAAEARARWAWIYQRRPVLIFEQSKPAALATFCQQVRYTPVLFRPTAAVVVAVPDELAGTPAARAGKGGP